MANTRIIYPGRGKITVKRFALIGKDAVFMLKRAGIFVFGGLTYCAIELAYRGRTHYTMALTGGACLLLLGAVNRRMKDKSLLLRGAAGGAAITAVEFAVGLVVNKLLDMNVWDYSDKPLNICGQICPQFTLAWMALSIPAMLMCSMLDGADRAGVRSGKNAKTSGAGKAS